MLKRFKKLNKTIFTIILMFAICINSYATTSFNDGSAFVTKAEFDSLMNNFSNTMIEYQALLNGKIDDAIAKYIAGLSGTTKTSNNILYSNWKNIDCFNGVVDPTFQVPNVSILIAGGANGYVSWSTGAKWYANPVSVRMRYSGAGGVTRPLVKNGSSEASGGGTSYWGGIANYYKETYVFNLGISNYSNDDMVNVERGGSTTYQFQNSSRIVISNGYISNFQTLTSVLNPSIRWLGNGQSSYQTLSFPTKTASNSAFVELGTDSSGNTTYCDHIIQYSGASEWWMSNPNFTKTFYSHSSNGYYAANLLSAVSRTSYIYVVGYGLENGSRYALNRYSPSTSFTTPNNTRLPSIGMFSNAKKANTIYLTDEKAIYFQGSLKKTLSSSTLEKGFPILYADKDTIIEWEPYFMTGKKYSNSSWIDSDVTKVKLMLSVGQFSDKMQTSNIIRATSETGTTPDGGVLCTIGTNEKIKFTMPKSGIVYAKWVPNTSSYDTDRWRQPLDLTKCNSYYVVSERK